MQTGARAQVERLQRKFASIHSTLAQQSMPKQAGASPQQRASFPLSASVPDSLSKARPPRPALRVPPPVPLPAPSRTGPASNLLPVFCALACTYPITLVPLLHDVHEYMVRARGARAKPGA